MATSPFSLKQFDICSLVFPLGQLVPIRYVIIINNTEGDLYSKEIEYNVIPLLPFDDPNTKGSYRLTKSIYIEGGPTTHHLLPRPMVAITYNVITLKAENIQNRITSLSREKRPELAKYITERFSFDL